MPSTLGIIASAKVAPPLPIPSVGLLGWFDADDAPSFDVTTGTISVWRDRSSNAAHAVPGAGYNNPAYLPVRQTGAVNGRAATSWDGASSRQMQSPMAADTKPFTYVIVAQAANVGANHIMVGTQGVVAPRLDVRTDRTIHAFAGGFGELAASTSAINVGQTFVVVVTESATGDWNFWLDGVAAGASTNNAAFTAGLTTQIGADQHNEAWFGYLCEIIKYSRVLTTTERQQVESYLKTKWGTP